MFIRDNDWIFEANNIKDRNRRKPLFLVLYHEINSCTREDPSVF